MAAARFPIRVDPGSRWLLKLALLSPDDSFVSVEGEQVRVHMGWAFDAAFPRSAVARVRDAGPVGLTRGVHGWNGRWLVNGSGEGIVALDLSPRQRARMMGIPVALRELMVSVEDPGALRAALGNGS